MATKVAVIGAGTWGTAVAALVCRNTPTTLWARSRPVAEDITTKHVNSRYLPEFAVPRRLAATASLEEALTGADVVVVGVPSHGFRAVLASGADAIAAGTPVVSLSKGVEQDTLKRMTEVATEVLPGHPVGLLTGPNLVWASGTTPRRPS